MKPGRLPFRASRDRWLVSYADLVTILLACFATTYAASHAAPSTPEDVRSVDVPTVVAAAVTVPLAAPVVAAPAAALPPPVEPRPEPKASLRDAVAPLVAASASSRIALLDDARGVVISLPESASFATGSAQLAPPAQHFLRQLADRLRGTPASLRIEGHTDSVPVAAGRYESNWELSTARASAVVAFLITEGALAPERLSAAGYGEFHPRVPNDSPEHRSMNRRVDVVLIDGDEH